MYDIWRWRHGVKTVTGYICILFSRWAENGDFVVNTAALNVYIEIRIRLSDCWGQDSYYFPTRQETMALHWKSRKWGPWKHDCCSLVCLLVCCSHAPGTQPTLKPTKSHKACQDARLLFSTESSLRVRFQKQNLWQLRKDKARAVDSRCDAVTLELSYILMVYLSIEILQDLTEYRGTQ